MRSIIFLVLLATLPSVNGQNNRQQIIETHLKNGAYRHHYTLHGWADNVNLGLREDATIAELWQAKALPYWKTRKYDLAVACYDKAVLYDRKNHLGRRGYLKCIFQKDYKGAIADMELAEKEFGYTYENDHSYPFYISLCYLQLNEFEKAEQVLQKDFEKTIRETGASVIHYLDLFYMGIIKYELRKYDDAIVYFDKSLAEYRAFSDAQYYKGLCRLEKGNPEQAESLMREAKRNFEQGRTFNEDDSFYEPYPYAVNWYMAKWTVPGYKE